MGYPPVVVVESGGVPRTQVAEGVSAPAYTVVESGARPITLADNAPPIALFNPDGTPYTGEAKAMNLLPVSADECMIRAPMPGGFFGVTLKRGVYVATDAQNLGAPAGGSSVYPLRRMGSVGLTAVDADPSSPAFTFSSQNGAQDYAFTHFINPNNVFGGSYHGGETITSQSLLLDGVSSAWTSAKTFNNWLLTRTTRITWSNMTYDIDYSIGSVDGQPGWLQEITRAYNGAGAAISTGTSFFGMEMPDVGNFNGADYSTDSAGPFTITLGTTELDLAAAGAVAKGSGVAPWATRVKWTSAGGYYIENVTDAPTALAGTPGAYARSWLQRNAGGTANKLYLERGSTSGGNPGDRTVTRLIKFGKL